MAIRPSSLAFSRISSALQGHILGFLALTPGIKEQGIYSKHQKPFTEYVITISYKGQTWNITKRYKALCILHSSLQKKFPEVQLPNADNLF